MISPNSWMFRSPADLKFEGYDDAVRIPDEVKEELTPDQIKLATLEDKIKSLEEQCKMQRLRLEKLEGGWWENWIQRIGKALFMQCSRVFTVRER